MYVFRACLGGERGGVDEDVARLEVSVDDGEAVVVEVAHARGDPDGQLQPPLRTLERRAQRGVLEQRLQVHTVHVLADDLEARKSVYRVVHQVMHCLL